MTKKLHHRASLTLSQAREVLRLRALGWTQARIAKKFGIHQSTVCGILRGHTYTSVLPPGAPKINRRMAMKNNGWAK
jgi:IS30 family transposase